jgi:RimJ/RimL family protein N-acetyltransferase
MPAPTEKVSIAGEKVVLREKRVEDAPNDYSWRVDKELATLDATRPLNMSYDSFLKYSKEELAYPNPMSKRLAIDTIDGAHIGNCMYYDIDLKRGEAELGIMIDREYWNRGYGTDTVDTLLCHIFTTTALSRVYLHTLEWNHRARKSFAKSGFREVKKVRRSGSDFMLMEIQLTDWERLNVSKSPGAGDPSHAASSDGATSPPPSDPD